MSKPNKEIHLVSRVYLHRDFYISKERFIVGVAGLMPVIAQTKIGRYYRTTIPRGVRKLLELNENDAVEWVFENGRIYVRKAQGGLRE